MKKLVKGQVWVETVIYTLIGLAIMGLLLAFVKPSIDKKKDQILIEQSEEMLRNIANQIEDVRYYGAGNSRVVDLKIKKGQLEIDGINEEVVFTIESKYQYSELDKEVGEDVKIMTSKKGKDYQVSLKLDYSSLNITFSSEDKEKIFQPSPTIYKLDISNNGRINDKINVDFGQS